MQRRRSADADRGPSVVVVVLGGKLLHRLHKRGDVIGIHPRCNAVPQIEHVAGAVAVSRQYAGHFLTNPRRRGIQHRRVHIAL